MSNTETIRSAPEGPAAASESGLLAELVHEVRSRVTRLQREYLPDAGQSRPTPWATATLASLRGAHNAEPGDDPEVWALTLADVPAVLQGRGDDPSRAETVIHTCLTVYAVHQQSRNTPAHRPGVGFGRAMGELARARSSGEGFDEATVARLHALATSHQHARRVDILRGIVQLMRADSGAPIGFDYGLLAKDLYLLHRPETARGVRLRWGRQLHERGHRADTAPADHATSDQSTQPSEQQGAH